ncbi:MAG: iron-containing alcohol dehydrogenase [Lachnospiraceae bacterium]|nr:iron-containing alcohol dehydrogenase [Lachnospiraceae bacterium]
MNMNVFMPTRVITGKGCVVANADEFAKLGKKCMIITGRNSAKACGALDDVLAALAKNDIKYVIYDQIGQNPLLTNCMEAGVIAESEDCDFIVGIGGGSPLDAAKCAAVFAANPEMDREGLYSLKWHMDPLPIVAVGTTAGTGSEVTKVSVITVPEGLKKSFHSEKVFPVVSFGDPAYTMTLSDVFTKSTAIDALAHCVESYFSRHANEISQAYAAKGVRILMDQFKAMIADPEKELTFEDREALYNASIYGGLAINVTGTCAPHTMGYLLTEDYKVPHGAACAAFMPAFVAYTKEVMPELVAGFYKEIGIGEEEFLQIVADITPKFPVEMTAEDVEAAHSRWVGNGSMAKGWGNFSPELADSILTDLYVK